MKTSVALSHGVVEAEDGQRFIGITQEALNSEKLWSILTLDMARSLAAKLQSHAADVEGGGTA